MWTCNRSKEEKEGKFLKGCRLLSKTYKLQDHCCKIQSSMRIVQSIRHFGELEHPWLGLPGPAGTPIATCNIFRFWSLRWSHSLNLSGSILQCTYLIPQSPAPAPELSCPCPPDVISRVYSIQKHHLIVFVAVLFLNLSCIREVDSLSLPTRHYCECVLGTLVRAHRTFALKAASHFVNPAQFSLVRCSSVFASLFAFV